MFEAKIVINYSSLETGCDLCLQRLRYKSAEKLFKKDEAQKKTNLFLRTDIFKNQNRLRIRTKSNGLSFNPSGSQFGLLITNS